MLSPFKTGLGFASTAAVNRKIKYDVEDVALAVISLLSVNASHTVLLLQSARPVDPDPRSFSLLDPDPRSFSLLENKVFK